ASDQASQCGSWRLTKSVLIGDESESEDQAVAQAGKEDEKQDTIQEEFFLPEPVRKFLTFFYRVFKENNAYEVHGVYESGFNKISDRFYPKQPWPEADKIAGYVNNGKSAGWGGIGASADDGCCRPSVFDLLPRALLSPHLHTRPANHPRPLWLIR